MLWFHQPAMHILSVKDVCRWAGQNKVTLLEGFGCSQCACADPIVIHYTNSSKLTAAGFWTPHWQPKMLRNLIYTPEIIQTRRCYFLILSIISAMPRNAMHLGFETWSFVHITCHNPIFRFPDRSLMETTKEQLIQKKTLPFWSSTSQWINLLIAVLHCQLHPHGFLSLGLRPICGSCHVWRVWDMPISSLPVSAKFGQTPLANGR